MKTNLILNILLLVSAFSGVKAQQISPETQQSIKRGCELFDLGRWVDARHEFMVAKGKLNATNHEQLQTVDFYLSACAVELGNGDAVTALLDFERRYPGSVYTDDIHFSLGSYYCSVGDMQRAAKYFQMTEYGSLSASRREQYDIRMGYVEFSNHNYQKASEYFRHISSKSEYYDHALYYQSYIDYVNGDVTKAKRGFNQLKESENYRDLVPYFLLQIEFQEGNYQYVVQNGEELAANVVKERRPEIERVIAEAWYRLEDYPKAVTHLDAYHQAGGEMNRESSYLYGFSLYRAGKFQQAIPWLRKACGAKDALTQNASYHLADCYIKSNQKREAMQAFAMAEDEHYDAKIAEDALFNYAKLQYELGGGAFNGAINLLQRYLERYPKSQRRAEARTLLIAAYYNSEDYDAAYRAIKAHPSTDADIQTALQKISYFKGLKALNAGKMQEAKRLLAESAQAGVSPKYLALNTFWLGEIAFAQKDYTLAKAKYSAYIRRAPSTEREYALSLYNLGYCALEAHQVKQAENSFLKFNQLYKTKDNYWADAQNRLGDLNYSARKFTNAISFYERAAKLPTKEQYYAQFQRAITLGIIGQEKRKQESLQQIIREGKGGYCEQAACELGRSLIKETQYAQATKVLEDFLQRYPHSSLRTQALSDLGLAYQNIGNQKKSLDYYKEVIASAPHSDQARNAMQEVREMYVSENKVDDYFDYASKVGMESDLTQLKRDSLSFAAAQKVYLREKGSTAIQSLRSYLNSYPKGSYVAEALYFLGDCYKATSQREKEIETLIELSEKGQGSKLMKSGLERLSSLTFEDGRFKESARAYRLLADYVTSSEEKHDAMIGYVRSTVARNHFDEIERMAGDLLTLTDVGEVALREGKYAYAEQLRERGERDNALKIYQELAHEVSSQEGSASYYRLIEQKYMTSDLKAIEKSVFDFSERSPKAYWLAKAYLLLGDAYHAKGDDFQARATWQSIADGYSPADDGIIEEAESRIRNLK